MYRNKYDALFHYLRNRTIYFPMVERMVELLRHFRAALDGWRAVSARNPSATWGGHRTVCEVLK
jgi:hypothetical protein